MDISEAIEELEGSTNVKFSRLLNICTKFFGEPRNKGTSHNVFKTPWQGKPWINLQKVGSKAKEYQVKQVVEALNKLKDMR